MNENLLYTAPLAAFPEVLHSQAATRRSVRLSSEITPLKPPLDSCKTLMTLSWPRAGPQRVAHNHTFCSKIFGFITSASQMDIPTTTWSSVLILE